MPPHAGAAWRHRLFGHGSPWAALLYAWAPMLLVYGLFTIPPLFFLRRREMDETSRAVWALAIVSAPVIGAIAFTILQPGQRRD